MGTNELERVAAKIPGTYPGQVARAWYHNGWIGVLPFRQRNARYIKVSGLPDSILPSVVDAEVEKIVKEGDNIA